MTSPPIAAEESCMNANYSPFGHESSDDIAKSGPKSPHREPPYIMRSSRAFRHFKNPPQPHMCIRDRTDDGQELFINVMSWTKICMPHSANDPIPLYGGMRVNTGSVKTPQLVFAVMANPAILKHVGRKCSDMEEKYALVKLMCDFVEAMNPGLKLARDAEVLKDRDLSGELKDIWGAVQMKRLREKDGIHDDANNFYIEFGPTEMMPAAEPLPDASLPPPPLASPEKEATSPTSTTASQSNIDASGIDAPEACNAEPGNGSAAHLDGDANRRIDEVILDHANSNSNQSPEHDSESKQKLCANNNTTIADKSKTTSSISRKKEKIAGFLPNSFPFIKSKTNHDKNSNKEKQNGDCNAQQKDKSLKKWNSNKDKKSVQTRNNQNLESDLMSLSLNK